MNTEIMSAILDRSLASLTHEIDKHPDKEAREFLTHIKEGMETLRHDGRPREGLIQTYRFSVQGKYYEPKGSAILKVTPVERLVLTRELEALPISGARIGDTIEAVIHAYDLKAFPSEEDVKKVIHLTAPPIYEDVSPHLPGDRFIGRRPKRFMGYKGTPPLVSPFKFYLPRELRNRETPAEIHIYLSGGVRIESVDGTVREEIE